MNPNSSEAGIFSFPAPGGSDDSREPIIRPEATFNDAASVTLSGSPSGCLAAGDEVLLINLEGALHTYGTATPSGTSTVTGYANVGNYEFLHGVRWIRMRTR